MLEQESGSAKPAATPPPTPTLEVDGKTAAILPGDNILQTARRAGAYVPSLCYDERLASYGSCRLCLVKVNGRLVASCTLKAEHGMRIETADDEIRTLRKGIAEMVLSLLPEPAIADCPKCRHEGLCELHQVAREVGAGDGRFTGRAGGAFKEDVNPFLGRNYERCINCYRCVRICDEIEGDNAITAKGRGFGSTIATWMDGALEDSSCEFCGQCIHTCPTGALFDKKMFAKKPADLLADEIQHVDTICPYCGTGCGLTLETARGKLLGSLPRFTAPASEGALCVKGQWGVDFIESKERLTTPLIKKSDGTFREATWDEALDLVATKLTQVKNDHGGDAFAGWASARTTSESNYLLMKFVRGVMGTNNIDNCQRT